MFSCFMKRNKSVPKKRTEGERRFGKILTNITSNHPVAGKQANLSTCASVAEPSPAEFAGEPFRTFIPQHNAIRNHLLAQEDHLIQKKSTPTDKQEDRLRKAAFERFREIADQYNLKEPTVFMAYSLYDRFCCNGEVTPEQHKLLPVTIMHMSAKYEEIYAPRMAKYSKFLPEKELFSQIAILEGEILERLKWEICAPNCLQFYDMMCYELQVPEPLQRKGMMLMETAIMSGLSVHHKPSVVAVSVLYWQCSRCHDKQTIASLLGRMVEWRIDHSERCEFIQDVESQMEESLSSYFLRKKYSSLLDG